MLQSVFLKSCVPHAGAVAVSPSTAAPAAEESKKAGSTALGGPTGGSTTSFWDEYAKPFKHGPSGWPGLPPTVTELLQQSNIPVVRPSHLSACCCHISNESAVARRPAIPASTHNPEPAVMPAGDPGEVQFEDRPPHGAQEVPGQRGHSGRLHACSDLLQPAGRTGRVSELSTLNRTRPHSRCCKVSQAPAHAMNA